MKFPQLIKFALAVACLTVAPVFHLQGQQTGVTWNPGAVSFGLWSDGGDWGGTVPGPGYKAFFNVSPAVPCVVNGTAGGCQLSIGDGGPGTIIVTNGGNLTCGDNTLGTAANNYGLDDYGWTGIGTGSGAGTMIIANGGNVTFRYHVWIGLSGGGVGTLIMNGGTALIQTNTGAFGIGTSGGSGNVYLYGGTLTINNNISIPNAGAQIDLAGGSLIINGDATGTVAPLISAGKIVAFGSNDTVNVTYNGTTTILAAATNAPPVTNTPVSLSIHLTPPNLTLFWPTSAVYYALQSSTNLVGTNAWQTLTNGVITSNGTNEVILPMPSGPTYFSLNEGVDPSTMYGKLLMGYQGWFGCPNDGSAADQWWHWFHDQTPTAAEANMDFLPDTSELSSNELFATQMTYSNGATVQLYSDAVQETTVRHFQWMQQNHLDGVFLQRFLTDLSSPQFFAFRNQVTENVRVGAETYGRVFAIMYDVSGEPTNTIVSDLTNDWIYLVNTMQITNSTRYLHHKGKPVVALWGFGFNDGNHLASPQQAQFLINWFKSQGVTVMGGVPTYWRTLSNDSYTNAAWTPVYLSFNVISPWAVGRFGNNSGADSYTASITVPDMTECATNGNDYMPVVFPGFSWYNENGGPLNQIPRNGGSFYWRQIYDDVNAGCNMIYGAMFDEVNEGTAMYKMVATPAGLPAQGSFLSLDVDGYNLPSDWYLQLANQAGEMLRGQIPLSSTMPITPP